MVAVSDLKNVGGMRFRSDHPSVASPAYRSHDHHCIEIIRRINDVYTRLASANELARQTCNPGNRIQFRRGLDRQCSAFRKEIASWKFDPPTSVQFMSRQSQCSRVLQVPSRTVGFTRRLHTLSSIQATNTSLVVVPQSPIVQVSPLSAFTGFPERGKQEAASASFQVVGRARSVSDYGAGHLSRHQLLHGRPLGNMWCVLSTGIHCASCISKLQDDGIRQREILAKWSVTQAEPTILVIPVLFQKRLRADSVRTVRASFRFTGEEGRTSKSESTRRHAKKNKAPRVCALAACADTGSHEAYYCHSLQLTVVKCCKVSWCLLNAVHSRCTQQEPVTTVQPRETECILDHSQASSKGPITRVLWRLLPSYFLVVETSGRADFSGRKIMLKPGVIVVRAGISSAGSRTRAWWREYRPARGVSRHDADQTRCSRGGPKNFDMPTAVVRLDNQPSATVRDVLKVLNSAPLKYVFFSWIRTLDARLIFPQGKRHESPTLCNAVEAPARRSGLETHAGTASGLGATVAERLACSPPTVVIRVQSPAGSLRIFACGNRARRCRRGFPVSPPFHSGAAPYSPQSPSSSLKTSMEPSKSLHSLLKWITDEDRGSNAVVAALISAFYGSPRWLQANTRMADSFPFPSPLTNSLPSVMTSQSITGMPGRGKREIPDKNLPTSGIVRHGPHLRKAVRVALGGLGHRINKEEKKEDGARSESGRNLNSNSLVSKHEIFIKETRSEMNARRIEGNMEKNIRTRRKRRKEEKEEKERKWGGKQRRKVEENRREKNRSKKEKMKEEWKELRRRKST
ncbi:hypothetical protein PR048_000822 [Dryococelus australis]|uniref:Uncharacterized protein n=1 Tax=Dryococelus australis TaxID=614101 RepID=A0ABQ9IFN0_9NEOP|nr:hypothetical protein PR048_000822 [Dryococelus australis]